MTVSSLLQHYPALSESIFIHIHHDQEEMKALLAVDASETAKLCYQLRRNLGAQVPCSVYLIILVSKAGDSMSISAFDHTSVGGRLRR